jgi:hypothetical protein
VRISRPFAFQAEGDGREDGSNVALRSFFVRVRATGMFRRDALKTALAEYRAQHWRGE